MGVQAGRYMPKRARAARGCIRLRGVVQGSRTCTGLRGAKNGAGSGPVGFGGLSRDCGSPDSSCGNEVVVPMLPGNRERVQDQSLRRLPTSASLFHCMNRSRRYASAQGEFILGPAECLSRRANPVHGVLAEGCGGRAHDSAARPQLGLSGRGPEAPRPGSWADGGIDPGSSGIQPSN